MVKDLGVIAFAKTKQLEKRIKAIEDWMQYQPLNYHPARPTPTQEVRDN